MTLETHTSPSVSRAIPLPHLFTTQPFATSTIQQVGVFLFYGATTKQNILLGKFSALRSRDLRARVWSSIAPLLF